MKFLSILFSYALLTSYVSAARRTYNRLEDRIARRAGHSARLIQRIEESVATGNETSGTYSTTWSGAVYTSPPSGQTWDAVTAVIVVPTLSVPSGSSSSGTYGVAAWVGIDGYTYQGASLQTGVDFTISNGVVSYAAWYNWLPEDAVDINIGVSAGDTITIVLSATSSTTGVVDFANNSTGQSVVIKVSSTNALAGQNAEWIVGAWMDGSTLVSPCDWGTVSFMSAYATASDANAVDPENALVINMAQNNVVLSSVSVSGSTITDTYV